MSKEGTKTCYCGLCGYSVHFLHVIDSPEMPDGCDDLLSVSCICVFWHREASNLEL
jgi:hypothetical protein